LFGSPNFILCKQKGLLEFFTPPKIAKENASNKEIHTPPIGTSIREINVSTKAVNTPSTKEDLILIRTFQDNMNKIVREDTSLDKDSDASINIIKPSPIDGQRALGNT
jgi:hypothetical protein